MPEYASTSVYGLLDSFGWSVGVSGDFPDVVFDFDFGNGVNFGSYKLSEYAPYWSALINLLRFMVIFFALLAARGDIFGG